MNPTGLPAPDDLAEAISLLGESTGYPLWASRLALARGDVALAYRGYLEHRRLINARAIPRLEPDPEDQRDGLDPAEVLRRQAQLPPRHDSKETRRADDWPTRRRKSRKRARRRSQDSKQDSRRGRGR